MKALIIILLILTIGSCNTKTESTAKKSGDKDSVAQSTQPTPPVEKPLVVPSKSEERPTIQYSERQLVTFLDSVGKLSTSALMAKAAFYSDSVFKNRPQLQKVLSPTLFKKLKHSIETKQIDTETAKLIFGEIDSVHNGQEVLDITLDSFDKNKGDLDEFAITLGYVNFGWSCDVYFFKRNKIISKHNIFHRYGLELEHFKDEAGKTIIYYKENFQSGTGIWWFNYYFYRYENDKLVPVLNELENANLQPHWGLRSFWLESFIMKQNPLTIKMVFHQKLLDLSHPDSIRNIVDDSTFVEYSWNEQKRILQGQYERSRISKAQILTYYLADNELLFINAYFKNLKNSLINKKKRPLTLYYLNEVKNNLRHRANMSQ